MSGQENNSVYGGRKDKENVDWDREKDRALGLMAVHESP